MIKPVCSFRPPMRVAFPSFRWFHEQRLANGRVVLVAIIPSTLAVSGPQGSPSRAPERATISHAPAHYICAAECLPHTTKRLQSRQQYHLMGEIGPSSTCITCPTDMWAGGMPARTSVRRAGW